MIRNRFLIHILLAFCLLFSLTGCQTAEQAEKTQEKYVLYIGFAEKTATETEAVIDTINEICRKHSDGYTMQKGQGGWTDAEGTFIAEETLI